eukprot:g3631.t1
METIPSCQDLEALKFAINRFAGGVIMVTGNEELCGMATEKWFMDGGVLHVENLVKADARSNAKTVEMPGEQHRRHLIEIEKKIHQHRKKPLSDKEHIHLRHNSRSVDEAFVWLKAHPENLQLAESSPYCRAFFGLVGYPLQSQISAKNWTSWPRVTEQEAFDALPYDRLRDPSKSPMTPQDRQLLEQMQAEASSFQFDPEIEDAYAISGLGENFRRAQLEFNLKLSLLVEQQPDEDPALDLLGFVAFKTWGPPVPGVSVGAVGAGEVRLRSLASAVLFYERLGYERREDEDEGAAEKTPACPDPERPAAEERAGLEAKGFSCLSLFDNRSEDGPLAVTEALCLVSEDLSCTGRWTYLAYDGTAAATRSLRSLKSKNADNPEESSETGLKRPDSDSATASNATVSAAVAVVEEATPMEERQWFYKDASGMVQGPYSSSVMSSWSRSGFFPAETMVRSADETSFTELGNGMRLIMSQGSRHFPRSWVASTQL